MTALLVSLHASRPNQLLDASAWVFHRDVPGSRTVADCGFARILRGASAPYLTRQFCQTPHPRFLSSIEAVTPKTPAPITVALFTTSSLAGAGGVVRRSAAN